MARALVLITLALALAGSVAAGSASAHPLGNFSVNRLAVVSVSSDRVDVRWILDQAEIPTFQERGRAPAAVLAGKRKTAQDRLALRVDGRAVPLVVDGPGAIAFPRGQGGLTTTRVELRFSARVRDPGRVEFADRTFGGRVGWKDVIVRAGEGTAVRSSVPETEPTRGLRSYPQDLLRSPVDRTRATFAVAPGDGTVDAPGRAPGEGGTRTADRGAGGFAGLFDDAASGEGVLVFLVLAAFGWGALHALSPGHGKTMVAAYLVGTRGTVRDALTLGATVTVTHTIGVFALGLVTLALSQYILPEDLFPWLKLTAGLLVVIVGAGVLRSRLLGRGEGHHHGHGHSHGHSHSHADDHSHGHEPVLAHHDEHGHSHAHEHAPDHPHGHSHAPDHPHGHAHAPDASERLSARRLVALGASAGLIPCPSALVVLLAAIAQHEIVLGLGLIVAFSLGLAATLTALGIAIVLGSGVAGRLRPRSALGQVASLLPALSALVILGVGVLLTAQAVPDIV